jgi:hypothetical protein
VAGASTSSFNKQSPVLRLIINKPLNSNCAEVTVKLKRALTTAQSGATVGALVIALDEQGHWTADLAGQLRHDGETLCQIAGGLSDQPIAKPAS